jgi:fatty-acyl-CoA synthase
MRTPDPRRWLAEPRAGRGIRLARDDGSWEYREYAELAGLARRVGSALAADGVRPGDVVCVLLPSGFECLAAFFGAWVAGATPCLITPPGFGAEDQYVSAVATIVRQAAPRVTVTSANLARITASALAAAGRDQAPWLWREAADPAEPVEVTAAGIALLQFTSGSTGSPRGVQVSWANLAANLGVIRSWLGWRDGDVTTSWLPLFHDMGLIGALLTSVTCQMDLWLMQPVQFIRDPGRWLECMAFSSFTVAPSFAFEYAVRRLRPERLATLDLSGCRRVIVGAEPIDPATLERFARFTGPAGFSPAAFVTAYGMAEATLAIAAVTDGQPRVILPDPATMHIGLRVRIQRESWLGAGSRLGGGWLVSCGRAADDVQLTVLDGTGRELPPGHLGEIAVRGPSVTAGYYASRAGTSTRFVDGWLRTGDAGFLHDGELFVLGRMGDSLKLRGRSVFVEDLEAAVAGVDGLSRQRCAVVSMAGASRAGVVLFAETPAGNWVNQARDILRTCLDEDAEIRVVTGRPGLIKRTTSGKPRRREMWELFRAGRLTAVELESAS